MEFWEEVLLDGNNERWFMFRKDFILFEILCGKNGDISAVESDLKKAKKIPCGSFYIAGSVDGRFKKIYFNSRADLIEKFEIAAMKLLTGENHG